MKTRFICFYSKYENVKCSLIIIQIQEFSYCQRSLNNTFCIYKAHQDKYTIILSLKENTNAKATVGSCACHKVQHKDLCNCIFVRVCLCVCMICAEEKKM